MSAELPNLRVAYLTGVYPKASHTFIEREVRALRDIGVEVLTASMRRPDDSNVIGPEEEAAKSETFYIVETARSPRRLLGAHIKLFTRSPRRCIKTLFLAFRTARPGAKGLLWQLFYFAEAGLLAQHLRSGKATHVHNHFADASCTVAMLTAELAEIPFSFTLHGPAELFEPESWHLGEKIARSTFTACISHFARSQAMLFSDPAHWHKLGIVHCGVHPERYDIPPSSNQSGLNLVFVGRLAAIKGLRVLFDAMECLRRAGRDDISLTLVGDGEDRAWAEGEAARLGGITLLGFRSQSEVAEALAAADALVLPSFAEGVPVVLMEAMASARPVIATQVGGVSELVEDRISGRIVPPGDVEALTRAIEDLASDPEMRTAMGLAGRKKVVADFDVTAEAAWLQALFQGEGGTKIRPDQARRVVG